MIAIKKTATNFQQADYTFKADYTNPISDSYTIETGAQYVIGYTHLDLGVCKKIFKGKAIVNLGVRDLFVSRISEQLVSQETFETYSFAQRGRFITLGISYGFGKGEAMTYSGGRRR